MEVEIGWCWQLAWRRLLPDQAACCQSMPERGRIRGPCLAESLPLAEVERRCTTKRPLTDHASFPTLLYLVLWASLKDIIVRLPKGEYW